MFQELSSNIVRKLSPNIVKYRHLSPSGNRALGLFTFFDDFSKYCETFSPDINNIANLVTFGNSYDNSKNDLNVSANSDKETLGGNT